MDHLGSWRAWLILAAVTIGLFVLGWMLSIGGNPMGKNKKKP
jgi:hypothetical protein